MSYYAVRVGRNPGIYRSWADCEKEVKGFPKASYKKFNTEKDAQEFVGISNGAQSRYCNPGSTRAPQQSSTSASFSFNPPPASNLSSNSASFPYNPPPDSIFTAPTQDYSSESIPQAKTNKTKTKTVLSSTRLLALKGTLATINNTVAQLQTYVAQADEQLDDIRKGKKRTAQDGQAENRSAKTSRTASPTATLTSENSGVDSVDVYTDGSCFDNGQAGARAGIGVYWGDDHPWNVAEPLPGRPTNNRAEIHAAVCAIKQAKEGGISNLNVHTDSQFLINSITKWIHKWKKNGWKLANGGDVLNRDDFEVLDAEMRGINVRWIHVKGHSNIHGNEMADRLANQGASRN